ncbi:MAG: hypothetical protein JNK74_24090 [Candidatus Hydrogenedentes bacterium]|nr:hypothetical protein [Candidatus Hydrogenedentota bacterium]
MWAWASAALIAATCISAAPRELTVEDKRHFYLKAETPVILADELMDEAAFAKPLREALDAPPLMSPASLSDRLPEGIFVGTAAHPGALAKRKFKRYLEGSSALGEEGYRIVVEKEGIVVLGGGLRGAWYGLHALAGLADQYDANLPHLDLRDWPELSVRGAWLTSMPTEEDVVALAALKCTHVYLESDDFHDLSGVKADSWRRVFEMARENYLEPVPVFSTLRGMESVLREHPLMIEGRAVTERLTLRGSEWMDLRYPNIIAEHPETVQVSISGVPCIYERDYTLEAQPLVAPFVAERPHWRIQRQPGGAIPDGAEVELRYNVATEDSSSLCFAAPESRAWLRTALERLITELKPRYIHLDHGAIGRMNQDTRSEARNLSHADAFAQSLGLMAGMIKEIDGDVKILMWSNLLTPGQGAGVYGLEAAPVPDQITRIARVHADTPGEATDRFEQILASASAPLIVALDGSAAAAQTMEQWLVAKGLQRGGMIALSGVPEEAGAVLDAAWSGPDRSSIWARLLNRHFDATLDRPDHGAVRAALVEYLNDQTLRGGSPIDARQRFDALCSSNPDVVAADQAGYELARGLVALLTDYLLLEERFAQTGSETSLQSLATLVAQVRASDPLPDAARYDQLLERITSHQEFVSPTELFLEDLRYYRADRPEHPQFEIPVRPVLTESPTETTATLPLLSGQAHARRLDIDGVNLASARLSGSHDGANFEELQTLAGSGLAGAKGAWLLSPPPVHPTLKLTLSAAQDIPMLKEVRLFGDKPAAEMECGYATITPAMAASFEGRPWALKAQAGAFLNTDRPRFASSPTAVRVTRTRSDLYIAIQANDHDPAAMIADLAQRDAPLWQQESVEIWLQPEGELPLRLVASPLGTQYDSEANDVGWDGDWEVVAAKTGTGWNALFRIPIGLVGNPKRGTSLPINIVRNRHGAGEERSAWAHGYGAQPDLQWGVLRFP